MVAPGLVSRSASASVRCWAATSQLKASQAMVRPSQSDCRGLWKLPRKGLAILPLQDSTRDLLKIGSPARITLRKTDCMAGHVGVELARDDLGGNRKGSR